MSTAQFQINTPVGNNSWLGTPLELPGSQLVTTQAALTTVRERDWVSHLAGIATGEQADITAAVKTYLSTIQEQTRIAVATGAPFKPELLGPVSFLYFASQIAGFDHRQRLSEILPVYQQLIDALAVKEVASLYVHEPILTLPLSGQWQDALRVAYKNLQEFKLLLFLVSSSAAISANADVLNKLAIDGLHVEELSSTTDFEFILNDWPAHRLLSVRSSSLQPDYASTDDVSDWDNLIAKVVQKFGKNFQPQDALVNE